MANLVAPPFQTSNEFYTVTFSASAGGAALKGGGGCTLSFGTSLRLIPPGRQAGQASVVLPVVIKSGEKNDESIKRELEVLRDCCRPESGNYPMLPLYVGECPSPTGGSYVVLSRGPSDLARRVGTGSKVKCIPQEPRFAIRTVISLLDALSVLHAKGWVHCDVQPKNMLQGCESDSVTLIDFGTCIRVGESEGVRERSWEFCAPEQWQKGVVDHRTDAFGSAGILFYLLSGHAPFFPGDDAASQIVSQAEEDEEDEDWEPYKEECRALATNVARNFNDIVASLEAQLNDHTLLHNSFSDDNGDSRGIRHLLWMAMGAGDERIDAATMARWLRLILAGLGPGP